MFFTVLQMLMGGGGSFSAGGPGKGMYSRLYLRVLNGRKEIRSFSAFNSIYNNTGLFGILATTGSDFVSKAIDIAVKELIAVATPGEVDQDQLDRAKEATKSAVLINLESRMIASEDIGRQVLTYKERKPVEHFLKAVDEVTLKDISSIDQKLLSSPLTMVSHGDGYQDGSVRIWDATYPSLLLVITIESEVKGIEIAGTSASVSALHFCSATISLAIGNAMNLVWYAYISW